MICGLLSSIAERYAREEGGPWDKPEKRSQQNLAERLCWQAARRDDARVARRLYRKEVVDGVYRLDEGALLDDFFHFLRELGVLELMEAVQGTALQREMVPVVQYLCSMG